VVICLAGLAQTKSSPYESIHCLVVASKPSSLGGNESGARDPRIGIVAVPSQESLLTPTQVAARLGVSKFTVARLYKAGRIPFVRIGRQVRIRAVAVEVFIQKQSGRAA
jgi:excisionase family DNA binding protein